VAGSVRIGSGAGFSGKDVREQVGIASTLIDRGDVKTDIVHTEWVDESTTV
jgi:hypothetical protein